MHTRRRDTSGVLVCEECFGSNANGAYGGNTNATQTTKPSATSGAARWLSYDVSVAGSHYAGIQKSDSSLWLWCARDAARGTSTAANSRHHWRCSDEPRAGA